MLIIPPQQLYINDTWPFTATATDGAPLIGAVQKVAGGSGYTSAPTMVFSAPVAGGRIATGTAVLGSDGSVQGITVTDHGVYPPSPTFPSVTLLGGGGSGAVFSAVLGNPIDLTGAVAGAELFVNKVFQDISSSVSVPNPVTGQIVVTVPKEVTQTCVPQDARAIAFSTRLHVYYTAGVQRFTVAVIPIWPTAP